MDRDRLDRLYRLDGRIAIVTGGSRGIGRAISEGFALAGAKVVVASRKLDAREDTVRAIEAAGGEALAVACHMGELADLERLVSATVERFGGIDVLVNNAANALAQPFGQITPEAWEKSFAVNLRGPFRLSSLVGTRMNEGDGGSILNISTIGSIAPSPGEVPYGAAKAGMNSMTIAMARAWAPKVRVNCIQPGPFLTDIAKAWDADALTHIGAGISLGRAGEPHEIVGAALYLASDASSIMTGAILRLDGGLR